MLWLSNATGPLSQWAKCARKLRSAAIELTLRTHMAGMEPGTAALFLLIRKVTADRVLEGIRGEGGTVMRTSLDHTKEAALQADFGTTNPLPNLAPSWNVAPTNDCAVVRHQRRRTRRWPRCTTACR
jgi:hypothetical protein